MDMRPIDLERRRFLAAMLSLAAAGGAGILTGGRTVLAMGAKGPGPIPQGMLEVAGKVRVNGALADVGTPVGPDDIVSTGVKGRAVFVVGDNAFLLGELSHLELVSASAEQGQKLIGSMRLNSGRLLSVLGKGKKEILTTDAIVVGRGTAVYVEVQPDRTYVCPCYGEVELKVRASDTTRESIRSEHHESPRFVTVQGDRPIEHAPVCNHTDEELVMLEAFVKRRPPFSPTPLMRREDAH